MSPRMALVRDLETQRVLREIAAEITPRLAVHRARRGAPPVSSRLSDPPLKNDEVPPPAFECGVEAAKGSDGSGAKIAQSPADGWLARMRATMRCLARWRHNPTRHPLGGFRCADCGAAGVDLEEMGFDPGTGYVRPRGVG